jgi:hypothetical protein
MVPTWVLIRSRCRAPYAEYNVSLCCETVTYCMVNFIYRALTNFPTKLNENFSFFNVTIPEIREREWVQLGSDKVFK